MYNILSLRNITTIGAVVYITKDNLPIFLDNQIKYNSRCGAFKKAHIVDNHDSYFSYCNKLTKDLEYRVLKDNDVLATLEELGLICKRCLKAVKK